MANWTDEEQKSAAKALMERSASDPAFRQAALADPAAAIKTVSGKDLPEGFKLQLVSNNGADLTLVLPDPVTEELSDADLEAVSGGRCGVTVGF